LVRGKTAGILVGRWKGKVGLVCIQVPEQGANGGAPTRLSRFGFRQQKFV